MVEVQDVLGQGSLIYTAACSCFSSTLLSIFFNVGVSLLKPNTRKQGLVFAMPPRGTLCSICTNPQGGTRKPHLLNSNPFRLEFSKVTRREVQAVTKELGELRAADALMMHITFVPAMSIQMCLSVPV